MIVMTMRYPIALALVGATVASASPVFAQTGALDGEWRFYGGDGGHTQYTGLDQIDRGNVTALQVVWRWKAENSAAGPFFNFESTPIMIGGILYTTTGASEVAAVDAETGQTMWLFTPPPKASGDTERSLSPKGQGAAWPTGLMVSKREFSTA